MTSPEMSTKHWVEQAEAALWRVSEGVGSERMAVLYMRRGLADD